MTRPTPKPADAQGQPPQDQRAATEESHQPVAKMTAPKPTRQSAPEKAIAEETRHRAHERYFWRRQLRAAHCLNWITAVGAIVAALGLVFIGASLLLTKEAVNDGAIAANATKIQAQAAFDANRPWVKVTLGFGDVVWNPFATNNRIIGSIFLKISGTNLGHLPARGVTSTAISYIENRKQSLEEAQKVACGFIAGKSVNMAGGGKLLFPNDSDVLNSDSASMTGATIEPSADDLRNDDGSAKPEFFFYIIGCVDYAFGEPAKHHQTYFSYAVSRFKPANNFIGFSRAGFPIGINIPMKEIRTDLTPMGNYAN